MNPVFRRVVAFTILFVLGGFGLAGSAFADGWIRVRPPGTWKPTSAWGGLEVTKHHVDVQIDGGLVEVDVREVFRNPHPRDLEGTYYFPIPEHATIEDFRATLGGKELAGEILPREEARRVYEKLVREVRDPALLEYYQRGMFRARVFPIPARGDVEVTIKYRQILRRSGGSTRFRYPLDTGRFTAGPYRDVRIAVDLTTDSPIRSITSPSHDVKVDRRDDLHARISFEAASHPAHTDFVIDYMTTDKGLAGGFRTFREPGEDGFFVLRLAPGDDVPADLPPRDLILVVDTSGSMAGQKIASARASLNAALDRLRPEDRFQILTFASRVQSFAEGRVEATPANLAAARDFVRGLVARGGTDIASALQSALATAHSSSSGTVLLISDGAPTVGIVNPRSIVEAVGKVNQGDHRIHVFGVGKDVNTVLLDDLSRGNRGSRTYLRAAESLELAVSGVLDKVLFPCLAGLVLSGSGVEIRDLAPAGPHDLFFGEDLVVAGRYRGAGEGRIEVTGEADGVRRTFVFGGEFRSHGGDEEAAYLWAQFRVLGLLDELRSTKERLRKSRLREEIVDLGLRYGIVTPYTSFLVQEDGGYVSRRFHSRLGRSSEARREMDRAAAGFGGASGSAAFDYSERQSGRLKRSTEGKWVQGAPPTNAVEQSLGLVKKGGKSFVPVGDVQVDGGIRGTELPEPDVTLQFGSDEFISFLRSNPAAAKVLSAGRSLIFRWDGKTIRVDDPGPVNTDQPLPDVEPSKPERKVEEF